MFPPQGKHALCHQDSRCKQEGYVCSKKAITNPRAVLAYTTAITKTTIYKNPKDYLLVCMQQYNTIQIMHAWLWSLLPFVPVLEPQWCRELTHSLLLTKFVTVSWYLLHWVIPCGHTHLCCKKDSLWRWHIWNEGASCCIRLGKWASNASPFCPTLLFFTLSPVPVINNSLSFLFLVFQYYYVRVKYILNTLCAAWE